MGSENKGEIFLRRKHLVPMASFLNLRRNNWGQLSGGSEKSSQSFEEGLSNSHLCGLVRNGDLEEGFKHLVSMVYRGYIPDIIPCTSLICGFC